MPDRPLEHVAKRGSLVEQRAVRAAGGVPRAEQDHGGRRDHRAEAAEREAVAAQRRTRARGRDEHHDRGRDRRQQHERLGLDQGGNGRERQGGRLPPPRRPLQHPGGGPGEGDERRVEEGLRRHQRRVPRPRREGRERRDREAPAVRRDAPREEVGGDRRERHQEGLRDLDREQRPDGVDGCEERAEHERVEDAVPEVDRAAEPELAVEPDALRHARVDELVARGRPAASTRRRGRPGPPSPRRRRLPAPPQAARPRSHGRVPRRTGASARPTRARPPRRRGAPPTAA